MLPIINHRNHLIPLINHKTTTYTLNIFQDNEFTRF